MKKLFAVMFFAAVLSGCASSDYGQYSKAQVDIATARHSAETARYKALSDIATSGNGEAKAAAVMALALSGQTGGTPSAIQAPQASQALQWASILVPGLTQVTGMRYNFLSQQVQSNNATALGISTNATLSGIAGKIQAPGSVTTTTNALSGAGTIGGGSYSIVDRNDVSTVTPAPVVVTPVITPTPVIVTPVVIAPSAQVPE